MAKLNDFITVHHITQTARLSRTLDLNEIKQKKLALRIITRNSPETYFLWRGTLMGFEYELMREFAKRQNVRLDIIVADNYQHMIKLLEQGKGDVIAAGLSRTEERQSELKFSIRYNRISELIVAHKDSPPINSFADLQGRNISIRQSSAFWQTAQQLAKEHGVNVIASSESIPTELLIAQVADKTIDLTIADSNLISIEKRFRNNLVTPLTLKENVPHAYAVRDNNQQLLKALNAFIKKEYRGTFYNVIKSKYFSSAKRLKRYRQQRISADSDLSPYDQLVKDNARKYQFDWRLITSQMFQESRFDPNALSAAGAQGLMQVLPRTGKEMGYIDLTQPQQSIAAGVQYMDWTRARFSIDLPLEEKMFFALAAYNAGIGHVRDAQKLAVKMGLSRNK
ncbi:MAG: transglycosylase, partial [Idiomarina sp.]